MLFFKESSDNVSELKQFFDLNFSQIYFIFYESFINVEINLKQKINKINKEELDTVLFIFQVIWFFFSNLYLLKFKKVYDMLHF